MVKEKHNFAIYFKDLGEYLGLPKFTILDKDLVHRVLKVLRLEQGDNLTLFNSEFNFFGKISSCSKKTFEFALENKAENIKLQPKVTVALGVLKRENFETAIYSCVELGVNKIQPIVFQKSVRQKLNYDRLQKIIISAAEQSKNFIMPELCEPVGFNEFVHNSSKEWILKQVQDDFLVQADIKHKVDSCLPKNEKICHSELVSESSNNIITVYCDVLGDPMFDIVTRIQNDNPSEITIIIGPEGDLTTEEKDLLRSKKVLFMKLTPTVLRSVQAVSVAIGGIRSIFR